MNKPTNQEIEQAEKDLSVAVKAVLLISGANKGQYGKLKDKLTNNYLLGSDQAMRILVNYQVTKPSLPFRPNHSNTGIHQGVGRGR
jgi:hypothetical protein